MKLVEYVRDRTDADVHVLVTRAATASRGIEFTMAFIGQGRFDGTSQTLRVITESAETEDGTRQRLAFALTLGVLGFIASEAVPADLRVVAEVAASSAAPRPAATDPWRRWIFSVNGSGELEAEESTEETESGLTFGADRITPQWKISFGREFNHPIRISSSTTANGCRPRRERAASTGSWSAARVSTGPSAAGDRFAPRRSTTPSWTWSSRRQLLPGFVDQSPERRRRGQRRIARGLSFTFEVSASRIRDQLSLPRRDATEEEVLLRLRQLSSGFETKGRFGLTYQFGSRLASIVNPRFGQ